MKQIQLSGLLRTKKNSNSLFHLVVIKTMKRKLLKICIFI